ncbi:hypothetical protein ACOSQ2_009414 [Xanthoceras sorbifolium]
MDGDEMVYPLAFGVGDGESEDGWTWFLRQMREAFGVPNDLVIISDQHKSISKAMEFVYPGVPHGICIYHLKQNLKKHCRGSQDILDLCGKAAYAYQCNICDAALDQIKNVKPRAYNMLMEAGINRWARAYMPGRRYQLMTTNIAEALNNCIKRARFFLFRYYG